MGVLSIYIPSTGQTRPLSPERSDGGRGKFSVENFRGESENVLPATAILEIDKSIKTTTLDVGNLKYESETNETISVYDFMDKFRSEGKINFKDKTYLGLGKFVEEINGIRSNGSKFWIYYVNGKKAEIGVSNYMLNPGDVVSWRYEKDIY